MLNVCIILHFGSLVNSFVCLYKDKHQSTNLQAMFPWPSPAKTTLSRNGTTCLLGYSQTLIDHHFVMAARFFETLKKNGLGSSAMTAARAVPLFVVNAFVLLCDVPVPPLSALPHKGK